MATLENYQVLNIFSYYSFYCCKTAQFFFYWLLWLSFTLIFWGISKSYFVLLSTFFICKTFFKSKISGFLGWEGFYMFQIIVLSGFPRFCIFLIGFAWFCVILRSFWWLCEVFVQLCTASCSLMVSHGFAFLYVWTPGF